MSRTASSKKVTNQRFVPILIVMILISVCMFAQADANAPQGNTGSKKTSTGKGKKQSGAKSEEKKTEAEPAGTEKAAGASDGDQEEAKGPWHGLTWRLIGPFRGGRVLAVSGVVGDQHTYYFGGDGWRSMEDHRWRTDLASFDRQGKRHVAFHRRNCRGAL